MTTQLPGDPQARAAQYVGRYRIVERVGRGAMGVVYRARDEAMNRDVALKVVGADLEDDPEIHVRFHREAQAAARLSHPNIITIFDVGEDGDQLFIVMELLHGSTLKRLLAQLEDIPLARKLNLMIQLCAGLGAAHRAHVCHRDIKPGNLFVRTDGVLKILDFGVARLATSSITGTGFIIGTPDYMSPEQARGLEIDARSDIFSAGGVCYFMLTGRKPFNAPNLPLLFHEIQQMDPEPLGESVPDDLAKTVLRALAKHPDARYQSCGELSADLEAIRLRYELELPPNLDDLFPDRLSDQVARPEKGGVDVPSTSTEDTVDLLPAGMVDSDDTVKLALARPWTERVATRLDAALGSALKRLGRGSAARPDPDARPPKRSQ